MTDTGKKIDFGQFKPRRAKRNKSAAPFVVGGLAVATLLVALIVGVVKYGDGNAVQQSVGGEAKPAADTGEPLNEKGVGPRPSTSLGGGYGIIKDWMQENANDPRSIEYVRWGEPTIWSPDGIHKCWTVVVRYRAKNSFGALTLNESTFYISHGKITAVEHD